MSDAHNDTAHDAPHDEWFQHGSEEDAAQEAHGAINAPFIIGFLLVVIAITFSLIFVILPYVGREVAGEKVVKSESNTDRLAREHIEAKTRWRMELQGDPRWVDLESRTVRIPLEYAAQEVVATYQQNTRN